MVMPYQGIIFHFDYPDYIVTAFLKFLGSILEGYTGDHIEYVADKLRKASRNAPERRHRALSTKASDALGFNQAGPSSS